jgi:uncharacterized membrane protein YciS (DUF1049 family)
MVISFFGSKLNPSQISKVEAVCLKLGILPDWLLAVMYFESKLNPQAVNSISGSVGLIQFTRDKAGVDYKTINGKKYQLDDLKKMDFIQQMDIVFEYFKSYSNKMSSFADVYLVTFFPSAVGKSDSYILQTSGLSASLIATQNPIFDTNKDKQITKSEFITYIEKKYLNSFKTPVKKKTQMEKFKQYWTDHKTTLIPILVMVGSVLGTILVTKMFFNVTKKKR